MLVLAAAEAGRVRSAGQCVGDAEHQPERTAAPPVAARRPQAGGVAGEPCQDGSARGLSGPGAPVT